MKTPDDDARSARDTLRDTRQDRGIATARTSPTPDPGTGPAWTGILVAAAAIRLWGVDAEGLWLDEVMQVTRASQSGFVELWGRIPVDKPPLAYYVLWPLSRLSLAESWLRLPSLLLGVATVGMVGLLARAAVPRSAGARGASNGLATGAVIAALALAAVSPLAVKLSREVLPYAAATAWVCLAYLAAVRARAGAGASALAWVALASALAIWTSYQAVAALVPLGAVALGWSIRDAGRTHGTGLRIAASVAAGALTGLPLLARLLSGRLPETSWDAGPFFTDTVPLVLGGLSAGFDGAPPNPVWVPFAGLVAVGVWSVWSSRGGAGGDGEGEQDGPGPDAADPTARHAGLLLCAWLGLGVALLCASAYARDHWIAVRYLLFFVPPWIVLCALGCRQLAVWTFGHDPRSRWVLAGSAALLVAASLPTLVAAHSSRPDHRGLARAIASQARPGDLVLFQHRLDEVPYRYYRGRTPGAPPSVSLQRAGGDPDDPAPGVRARIASARRIWVPELVYHWLPVRDEVRAFFLPDGREPVRRGPVAVRPVEPGDAAAALFPRTASPAPDV